MSDNEQFDIEEGRGDDLPIFVHSEIDDLPLTPNEFRVYGHLARRAGRNNLATPSYGTMAEICFRPMYRKAKAANLRQKVRDAVKALERFGLIERVERRAEDGRSRSNAYRLMPRRCWNWDAIRERAHEIAYDCGDFEEEGGGDQRPLGDQRPGTNVPQGTNVREGTNVPEDTPIEDTPIEDTPKKEQLQTTGGPGGGGGPDDSGGVLGVSSRTEGGGSTADIPAHIADQWVKLFGEMTQEQGKFLVNQLKAQGAGMVDYALGIAADNMAAGTEVRKPALYVKTIIAKRIADGDYGPAAHRRPGEVDSEAKRKEYILQ